MTAVLTAQGVVKRYRSRDILTGASLTLEAGTLTALLGRNGAGKSTLLRICAGWTAAASGVIMLNGEVWEGGSPHLLARRGLFYLPDRGILSPSFTLRRQGEAVLRRYEGAASRMQGVAARLRVDALLDRRPHTYSGGERRRAEIALAWLRSPDCLLADEPLRGIDPRDAEAVLAGLRDLAENGCAVLVTGHELPTLLAEADQVIGLAGGTTQTLRAASMPRGAATASSPPLPSPSCSSAPSPGAGSSSPSTPPTRANTTREQSATPSGRIRSMEGGSAAPRRRPLHIDEQTLRDIEVFQSQDGGPALFDLLDKTRTSGGRTRLRQRFRAPIADAREIRETQEMLRFVLRHAEAFTRLPSESQIRAVKKYIGSPYVTRSSAGGIGSWLTGLRYRLRYRDLFESAEQGIRATRQLLQAVHGAIGNVRWLDAPAPLAGVVEDIVRIVERHETRQLGAEDTSAIRVGDVLPFDHLIRERLRSDIERVIAGVHELDALRSMAEATKTHGFGFPEVRERDTTYVTIQGSVHPFLDTAIPNDLELGEGRSLLFLTGPNMAGKTTYIRGVALCVYLAHLGMGVPAQAMVLSPFDALFSSINTVDTVRLGYSYYYSEVRRVKEAAALMHEGRRLFAVFDELFKGTNVRDAYDASRAVLMGLARARHSAILVSSHLTELADDLHALESVLFRYFDADVRGDEPIFSYQLREGTSSQRLGMLLLERERVLQLLDQLPRG